MQPIIARITLLQTTKIAEFIFVILAAHFKLNLLNLEYGRFLLAEY